jgi:hypothetical protein
LNGLDSLPYENTFACKGFVSNDLWLRDGVTTIVTGGYDDDHGGNGQFLVRTGRADGPLGYLACMGYECRGGWKLRDMQDLGYSVLLTFDPDCEGFVVEQFEPGSSAVPISSNSFTRVEDCGDGFGDCP